MKTAERLEVVLEVLHVGHAAQGGKDARMGADEPECPGGDGCVRIALFELGCDVLRDIAEPAAKERFHDRDRQFQAVQLLVEVFCIDIAYAVCVAPVHVVHFDLDEIPVVLLMGLEQFVKFRLAAVEGESHLADAARLTFLEQEIHHAVFDIALAEGPDTAAADRVHQVVVEIIGLQLIERVVIHLLRCSGRSVSEIGKLRSDVIRVARIAAQRNARCFLRLALQVGGGRVIVIYTTSHSLVNQGIDTVLVDDVAAVFVFLHLPAHTTVAEQGDLVAVFVVDAVFHLAVSGLEGGDARFLRSAGRCRADRQRAGAGNLEEISSGDILFHMLIL